MSSKRNKKVIYTAIFGKYEGLVPQKKIDGYDFICFTDNPLLNAHPWKNIVVKQPVPNDATRSNRKVKILAHEYVSDYEQSIYIDGNFLIIGPVDDLVTNYLLDKDLAAFSHENTSDKRNCIYDEYDAILELSQQKKISADPEKMKSFIEKLIQEGYPKKNGLIKGGVLARNHNKKEVIELMEFWWSLVEKYSKRDQLSFNYAAWKKDFSYAQVPGDIRKNNKYVFWLGRHRKKWILKPLKVKLKLKLARLINL